MQPFHGADKSQLFNCGYDLIQLKQVIDVNDKSTIGNQIFRFHLRVTDIDVKRGNDGTDLGQHPFDIVTNHLDANGETCSA